MLLKGFSLEKEVRFVIALGLVILLVVGWFSYNSISQLFKPFGWITHTQEVLVKIGTLTNQLTDVQTSVRGYVLTGEKKYLTPYHAAIKVIPVTLAQIMEATKDNPRQQSNLILLKVQIKTFQHIYSRIVRLRKTIDEDKIDLFIKKDSGFDAMNAVMKTIAVVNLEEQNLLVFRDADELRVARNIRWTIFIIISIAALVGLVAGVNINQHITAVNEMNEKLREKEAVIFQFLSGLPIGVFVVKPDGKTFFANHAALQMLGRDLKPMEDFYEFKNDNQAYLSDTNKVYPREKSPLALALQGVKSIQTDMEIHRPDGKVIAVEVAGVPIFGSGGELTYALTAFTDISERIKHQAELKSLALRDDLTGLFNRRGFMTLGEQELRSADRTQTRLLLLFIDLDGFKQVNDREGHQSGDEMLKEFAQLIREHFRKADIVGRLGGDEFAVITEDGPGEDSAMIHRLREKAEVYNQANPSRSRLEFSVGLVIYDPRQPCGLDRLISRADEKMYVEKENKKNNPSSEAKFKSERA